jgi:hypothetical protein
MFWRKEGIENTSHMYFSLQNCWEAYPSYKLNIVFTTLFNTYNSIFNCGRGNDYKIKHINKIKLVREGKLPIFMNRNYLGNTDNKTTFRQGDYTTEEQIQQQHAVTTNTYTNSTESTALWYLEGDSN